MTKPGIVYGNLITATAGYFFALKSSINFMIFFATIIGISLIIGSAGVINNYLDKNIDKEMQRTKERALVQGKVTDRDALIFAGVLFFIGFILIGVFTNNLVLIIGLVAFIDYVVLYGYAKRNTIHSTIIGSVSGAAPILAGYCAVTNKIGLVGVLLFLTLLIWQMPHFYSIAIYRLKDYEAAKLPVLPVIKGLATTKKQIIIYIFAFTIVTSLFRVFNFTNNLYLIIMLVLNLSWLYLAIYKFRVSYNIWSRKMFHYSLVVLLSFSILISFN